MTGDKWFRPKRFGYGATPNTWKGWAFVGVFVAMVFVILRVLSHVGAPSWLAVLIVIALAGATIPFIKAKTSGEWRWRWH